MVFLCARACRVIGLAVTGCDCAKATAGRGRRGTRSGGIGTAEPLESRVLLARIYVDADAVGATHDGTSWGTACQDLQAALGKAKSGDEILIASGTYRPTATTDRTISFQLKNAVSLLGGYAGYGAADPNARDVALYPTVLSGDIGTADNNVDNSYHVVTGSSGITSATILDGLSVTGGNANGNSSNSYGGGMYNSSSSPTVTNCRFIANSATYSGGGMYDDSSSSPTLTNCTFGGCSAGANGGAMHNHYSSPTLTNCTFRGNSASSHGGGLSNASSMPNLTGCIFGGNSASYGGGVSNDTSSPTLTNCAFSGNAAGAGGGMHNDSSSPRLNNCTFSGNTGSGIYNTFSSSPTLTNCIVWGSGSSPIYTLSGTPMVSDSDIQGGYAGTGNTSADPLFVRSPWAGLDGVFGTADDDFGDLRLRVGSPALDIGANSAIPAGITTDLGGNSRIQNGVVDLGAYEGPIVTPAARTFYVDVAAAGAKTGANWTNAFTSVQSALLAATDGDTIQVADGVYKPTVTADRAATFSLRNAVAVCGGYAGHGTGNPDARDEDLRLTVLSGDLGTIGSKADNSYHVVTGCCLSGTAILDGFRITAGNASDTGVNGNGAGMYNTYSSPTLSNCTFSGNSAITCGSGLYNYACPSPTLISCTFSGNSTNNHGGGVYNTSSSPTLINCTFSGNSTVVGYGGGMANYDYSSPRLTNCTFNGNRSGHGGGMYNNSSAPTLTSCTFAGNSAQPNGNGGGMCNSTSSPTLTNCTFSGNVAYYGGGMYNSYSSPVLTNCTLNANSAGWYGGAMYNSSDSPTLTNCIVWGSGSAPIYNSYSTPVITYSDIEGGYVGAGNISADPLFIRTPSAGLDGAWATADDDYGDLRLRHGSPVIDAGNNVAPGLAGVTTDLAGQARFVDVPGVIDRGSGTAPIVDMGACEFASPTDVALANGSIAENQPVGATVGCFSSTDPDPTNTFTYALVSGAGSTDNARFTISGNQLKTAEVFGQETSYSIRVRTTDAGGLSLEKVFFIAVTPVALTWNGGTGDWTEVSKWSAGSSFPNNGNGGFTYSVIIDSGTVTLNQSIHIQSLTLGDGASLRMAAGGGSVLTISNLTINGTGRLDLGSNAMVVEYGSGVSPIGEVVDAIKSGRNGGTWDGRGICSLSAGGGSQYALGVTDNSVAKLTSFAGQTVDQTSVLIRFTYSGDANLDSQVDLTDLSILAGSWQIAGRTWSQGDADYSGLVDLTDLVLLASNWQKVLPTPLAAEVVSPAIDVPAASQALEPAPVVSEAVVAPAADDAVTPEALPAAAGPTQTPSPVTISSAAVAGSQTPVAAPVLHAPMAPPAAAATVLITKAGKHAVPAAVAHEDAGRVSPVTAGSRSAGVFSNRPLPVASALAPWPITSHGTQTLLGSDGLGLDYSGDILVRDGFSRN